MLSRDVWAGRHFPLLKPDGENGGSGTGAGTEGEPKTGAEGDKGKEGEGEKKGGEGDDLDKIEGLGDKGKEAIRKEREAAKAAGDRAKAAEEERDALKAEKTKRDEEAAKKKDEDAAAAGKWEELATKRETDLTAAKADVTRLTGENDQLRTAITGVLDSEWKELPAEVRDAYLGADDDPLSKLAFLPKAKTLAAKLAEKDPARGNGRDPKPKGEGKPELKPLISKAQFLG